MLSSAESAGGPDSSPHFRLELDPSKPLTCCGPEHLGGGPMRIEQFISGEAIDRLGDVVLLVGLNGRVLDANRAALACYGYSHAEMLALSNPAQGRRFSSRWPPN